MSDLQKTAGRHKFRIFIVDDHSILCEGLSELIDREEDLTVCGQAGDILSAVQAIENCSPDVVIIDLTLGDGNGIRLIENLLYSRSDSKILVLSMHDESIHAERCLKAGAKGYIMKQEPSQKLLLAIRKVLKGEIYVSDKLGAKLLTKFTSNKIEASASPLGNLSNREIEIYMLIGSGEKKHAIAEKLNLSVRTVETYIDNIKKKMNLKDTHEVILHAVHNTMVISDN